MLDSPRPRSPNPSSYNDKFQSSSSSTTGTLRRKSGLKSRATQILAIRFGWVVLVIWYEVGDFFHALSTCRFPDSELLPSGKGKGRWKAQGGETSHLVLLADPHVPHPRLSYGSDSRPWINALRQGMDELFMRKSWNVVMRLGRVDGVVVVGDMLDWGRGDMSDKECANLSRGVQRKAKKLMIDTTITIPFSEVFSGFHHPSQCISSQVIMISHLVLIDYSRHTQGTDTLDISLHPTLFSRSRTIV